MGKAGSQGEVGPGERNYPSQATASFEMVLSPGAGRASAAVVQPPPAKKLDNPPDSVLQ